MSFEFTTTRGAVLCPLELIVMFCCGEERHGKFCSECGSPAVANTVQRNLADYLDRQAKTVKKNIDNRLKHDPDIAKSTVVKWNEKVAKWEEWRDWVLSVESET